MPVWLLAGRAFGLMRPALRHGSARPRPRGSSAPLSPAAVSSSAPPYSLLAGRRGLSLSSTVLLTPAHWQHRLGTMGQARRYNAANRGGGLRPTPGKARCVGPSLCPQAVAGKGARRCRDEARPPHPPVEAVVPDVQGVAALGHRTLRGHGDAGPGACAHLKREFHPPAPSTCSSWDTISSMMVRASRFTRVEKGLGDNARCNLGRRGRRLAIPPLPEQAQSSRTHGAPDTAEC